MIPQITDCMKLTSSISFTQVRKIVVVIASWLWTVQFRSQDTTVDKFIVMEDFKNKTEEAFRLLIKWQKLELIKSLKIPDFRMTKINKNLVHVDIWLTTYLPYVDNRGHLTDHLPTSSCPRSFWMVPYKIRIW